MATTVAAFYLFVAFAPAELVPLRERLQALGRQHDLRGTVLLAEEGINGTISGGAAGVEALLAELRADPRLAALEVKRSEAPAQAFHRFKVRRKREIVTLGRPEANPADGVGTYVSPAEWDTLIADPDTLVIDTRNTYEVALGTFEGAIDPGIESFRDFPAWAERELRPLVAGRQPKALALFCTGGIRCEKATAWLLRHGYEGVHHLQGGILRYLQEVPVARSRWRGECYVFDQRVAVDHRLQPGSHTLCHACGLPLAPADRKLESYVAGVSCRYCLDRFSDGDRKRFAERQRQIERAEARGVKPIGPQAQASP